MLEAVDEEVIDHELIAMRDVFGAYRAFQPPRRVSVSQGAAENLIIKQPGGPADPWNPLETPYMVEPMDVLASRQHEAEAFVGPARTGKTAGLLVGWIAHCVKNDPGDMLVINMTQDKARIFSKTDVDRAIRYSPSLKEMSSASAQDDTVHDKMFKHGMRLHILWPTVSNVSGTTYRYTAVTDLDRIADSIGGEGALFPHLIKRTTTFMSRGMALAESSPGRDLVNPNWVPTTPHEAPPTTGILGIYNTGDRRRWHWKCPDCRDWFEAAPGLGLFRLPDDEELRRTVVEADLNDLANRYNRVVCPHCAVEIPPKMKGKMNLGGRWLREGQRLTADDVIEGEGVVSNVATFWLGGVAAAFQSWKSLLMRYFQALRHYELSGDEESLRNTVNVDQGMPYMPRYLVEAQKTARDPSQRKDPSLERFVCPDWTRFLMAEVDVQGGVNARFVVQVHAHGAHGEKTVIDRYNITDSMREGMGGFAPIDPTSHAEDWDVLTEKVLRSTYRTSKPGLELGIMLTVVDTGGEHKAAGGKGQKGDGVSDKAYAWYRRLRRERIHGKVMLIKGASSSLAGSPIKESWVGNRGAREKGDVPIYFLDTNRLKDMVDKRMKRTDPGPGYMHLPDWLPKPWFDELQAEVRGPDGKWTQIRARNETMDLLAYDEAGYLRLGADKIGDWSKAPPWAAPLFEGNINLVTREERRELQANVRVAETPVPVAPVRRRRVSRSSYLS